MTSEQEQAVILSLLSRRLGLWDAHARAKAELVRLQVPPASVCRCDLSEAGKAQHDEWLARARKGDIPFATHGST